MFRQIKQEWYNTFFVTNLPLGVERVQWKLRVCKGRAMMMRSLVAVGHDIFYRF
jgi:hypothetical protein